MRGHPSRIKKASNEAAHVKAPHKCVLPVLHGHAHGTRTRAGHAQRRATEVLEFAPAHQELHGATQFLRLETRRVR